MNENERDQRLHWAANALAEALMKGGEPGAVYAHCIEVDATDSEGCPVVYSLAGTRHERS